MFFHSRFALYGIILQPRSECQAFSPVKRKSEAFLHRLSQGYAFIH